MSDRSCPGGWVGCAGVPVCACKGGGLSIDDRTGGRERGCPDRGRAEAGLLVHVIVVMCGGLPVRWVRWMGRREGEGRDLRSLCTLGECLAEVRVPPSCAPRGRDPLCVCRVEMGVAWVSRV
jgi:hypothetical protein